ncbi:pyrophosphatase [Colwellia phage 9A]|uniref:Glutaredoxin 3 n=1 Tax=Colwellia phage 9A TaxID=765765 RepID=I3UMG5_9CAUD|nr:pyrophosphatase [Colwellia phage 9A]AFK66680.1 glutaredoxin 3 [Colwellia phage 9A]
MNKNVKVYSKAGCTYCDQVKAILTANGLEYVVVNIDEDTKESNEAHQLITTTLGLTTVPQVFIDGKRIGGLEDTTIYLEPKEDDDFSEFQEDFQPRPESEVIVEKTCREKVMDHGIQDSMALAINQIQSICHGLAKEGGWWDRKGDALAAHNLLLTGTVTDAATLAVLTSVANQERNPLELIALMHSELSEGLEGVRKDQMDDKLPHRKMIEVELADAIVRILDASGGWGLDVGGALVEKLVFNITRSDHQPENRLKADGKKY